MKRFKQHNLMFAKNLLISTPRPFRHPIYSISNI